MNPAGAATIISAGYSVIIDAAFLKHEQRKPFQQLAKDLAVAYSILKITAPAEILRQRIKARKNDVSDADLSVLEYQLSNCQALHASEMKSLVTVNTTEAIDIDTLIDQINAI